MQHKIGIVIGALITALVVFNLIRYTIAIYDDGNQVPGPQPASQPTATTSMVET